MISFNFRIRNPWSKETSHYHLVECDTHLTGNKFFQLELYKHSAYNWFSTSLDLNWTGHDHAGPDFEIELFGVTFHMGIYDSRHWDYDENKWEIYENPLDEVNQS